MRARAVPVLVGVLLALATGASAATLKVNASDTTPDAGGCGSSSNPCQTIQGGVDNALPGDVVSIARGLYPELVVVETADLTLKGAGTLTRPAEPDPCPGDPTRTVLQRCSEIATEPECEAAWAITSVNSSDTHRLSPTQHGACYWDAADSACRFCDRQAAFGEFCANACGPLPVASLLVTAPGVRIEKLRFREIGDGASVGGGRAGIAVTAAGEGAAIQKVRMDGIAGDCIFSAAPGTTVASNTLRSCGGHCIAAHGEGSVVTRNRVRQCGASGVSAAGRGTVIARNSVLLTRHASVRFGGEEIVIERNRLSATQDHFLSGGGASFVVARNKARVGEEDGFHLDCEAVPVDCTAAPDRLLFLGRPGEGVERCLDFVDPVLCEQAWSIDTHHRARSCFWDVGDARCRECALESENDGLCANECRGTAPRCTRATVVQNRVEDVTNRECMDLDTGGPGLVVERNKVAFCEEEGFDVTGVEAVLRGNQVSDCGSEIRTHGGFEISGTGHLIDGNTVQRCAGDGFVVEGTAVGVMLTSNKAIDNGGDGFDVEDGATNTTIDAAFASANADAGIEVSAGAVDTTVRSSRAAGHLVDFCDEGTGTDGTSGNRFGVRASRCTDP